MTPGQRFGQSPGMAADDGYHRQSNMTEMTEMKQGYGKSIHAIESKPFEVSREVEEVTMQQEDEDATGEALDVDDEPTDMNEETKRSPAQQIRSSRDMLRVSTASKKSRVSHASSGRNLDPVSRAYKYNPYLKEDAG